MVLASFDNNWKNAIYSISGGAFFLFCAVFALSSNIAYLQKWLIDEHEQLSDAGLTIALACMCIAAWFTDLLGLHAVFGAFIVGSVIPRGAFADGLTKRIEPLAVALLLPLFFTYSGLNTKISLLNSWYLWGMCAAILLVAVLGKGVHVQLQQDCWE